MKNLVRILTLTVLFGAMTTTTKAQDDNKFKNGSVYEVTMIHTHANKQDEYLNQLMEGYVSTMEKAKEQGLILSYKLLSGAYSNEDDFDVLLLIEFKSMSMLDENPEREAKWKAIEAELATKMGGKDKVKAKVEGYQEIRTFRGTKMMREVNRK